MCDSLVQRILPPVCPGLFSHKNLTAYRECVPIQRITGKRKGHGMEMQGTLLDFVSIFAKDGAKLLLLMDDEVHHDC